MYFDVTVRHRGHGDEARLGRAARVDGATNTKAEADRIEMLDYYYRAYQKHYPAAKKKLRLLIPAFFAQTKTGPLKSFIASRRGKRLFFCLLALHVLFIGYCLVFMGQLKLFFFEPIFYLLLVGLRLYWQEKPSLSLIRMCKKPQQLKTVASDGDSYCQYLYAQYLQQEEK